MFIPKINREETPLSEVIKKSPLGEGSIGTQNDIANYLGEELAFLWAEIEIAFDQIPIVERIVSGAVTKEDYMQMLLCWRQQVVDGGRWFARAISSFNVREHAEYTMIRQFLVRAISEEHSDYQQLENDYVGLGGDLDTIQHSPQNLGTYMLSSFLLEQANKENPIHLFGAMFVIEGMGKIKAGPWGDKINEALKLEGKHLSFLQYHYEHDQVHHSRLGMLFQTPIFSKKDAVQLVKVARATASLYAAQLAYLYDC